MFVKISKQGSTERAIYRLVVALLVLLSLAASMVIGVLLAHPVTSSGLLTIISLFVVSLGLFAPLLVYCIADKCLPWESFVTREDIANVCAKGDLEKLEEYLAVPGVIHDFHVDMTNGLVESYRHQRKAVFSRLLEIPGLYHGSYADRLEIRNNIVSSGDIETLGEILESIRRHQPANLSAECNDVFRFARDVQSTKVLNFLLDHYRDQLSDEVVSDAIYTSTGFNHTKTLHCLLSRDEVVQQFPNRVRDSRNVLVNDVAYALSGQYSNGSLSKKLVMLSIPALESSLEPNQRAIVQEALMFSPKITAEQAYKFSYVMPGICRVLITTPELKDRFIKRAMIGNKAIITLRNLYLNFISKDAKNSGLPAEIVVKIMTCVARKFDMPYPDLSARFAIAFSGNPEVETSRFVVKASDMPVAENIVQGGLKHGRSDGLGKQLSAMFK